jgi:hypothetical protein
MRGVCRAGLISRAPMPPRSSFPIPPRPRSLSWFSSVIGGAPSFVPCWFVVVPFVVDDPHHLFVAPFVCCGGPPFICRGAPPSFVVVVPPSFIVGCPPSFVLQWWPPALPCLPCGSCWEVMQLLAPTIHPASSGLQAWGRVLGCRLACPAL